MSQTNFVECPICGRSFPASSVNEHVNKCLNAHESSSTSGERAGTKTRKSCNSSASGRSSSTDESSSIFGKRPGTEGNTLLMASPPSGTQKRSLSNSSNLAGKSRNTPPFKKLKANSSKKTDNFNGPSISGTKDTASFQNFNSSFPGKQVAQKSKTKSQFTPLAERMRPETLAEYVGQSKVLGSNSLLRTLLEAEEIPSMILWGPPGCGKVNNVPTSHIPLGRGYSRNFYTGKLCPEVQTLTILYTIFDRKGNHFLM